MKLFPTNISSILQKVIGPGRGPLIQASLNASRTTGIPVQILGVEKNSNAVVTLRNRFKGNENVSIIFSDIRELESKVELSISKADIIVSELLGSWGDNESSPECLDCAQKYLNDSHSVMIPQKYTSFCAPITCTKLWLDAKNTTSQGNDNLGLDSHHVVHFHRHFQVCEPVEVFRFDHPNDSIFNNNAHNRRMNTISFCVPEEVGSCVIHGFAGYFETLLYDDITLSTVPSRHSVGGNDNSKMFSWFPIFIPLRSPITVKSFENIQLALWRNVDKQKMWYEWSLVSPALSCLQNENGESYSVFL